MFCTTRGGDTPCLAMAGRNVRHNLLGISKNPTTLVVGVSITTHNELALNGVYTDFLYEKDGEQGLWLEVIKVNA